MTKTRAVLRWYPARLIPVIFFTLAIGGLITGIAWSAITWISHGLLGAVPFSSPASLVVAWLLMAAGVAWLDLYGEIRGWWTSKED